MLVPLYPVQRLQLCLQIEYKPGWLPIRLETPCS